MNGDFENNKIIYEEIIISDFCFAKNKIICLADTSNEYLLLILLRRKLIYYVHNKKQFVWKKIFTEDKVKSKIKIENKRSKNNNNNLKLEKELGKYQLISEEIFTRLYMKLLSRFHFIHLKRVKSIFKFLWSLCFLCLWIWLK